MTDVPKFLECECGRLTPDSSGRCRDCRELGYQRSRRHADPAPTVFAVDDGGTIAMKGAHTAQGATRITKRF